MKNAMLAAALLLTVSVAGAAPNLAAGAKLYGNSCAGCHGNRGQGAMAPSLKASAAWTPAQFKTAITKGKSPKGKAFAAVMPRFPQLKDSDLRNMQAYLKKTVK